MPLTPQQIDALPDYTDAQLLKLVRHTIAEVVQRGHSLGMNGRNWTSHNLPELRKMELDLIGRTADEDEGGNGRIALAVFGAPPGN